MQVIDRLIKYILLLLGVALLTFTGCARYTDIRPTSFKLESVAVGTTFETAETKEFPIFSVSGSAVGLTPSPTIPVGVVYVGLAPAAFKICTAQLRSLFLRLEVMLVPHWG